MRCVVVGLMICAAILFQAADFPAVQGQEVIPARPSTPIPLKTVKDQISYSLGLDIGMNLRDSEVELDADLVARGLKDALQKLKPSLTEEQIGKALQEFQRQAGAKSQERLKVIAEKNKKDGAAYLVENKKKKEVQSLASGLQVQIIKQGKGGESPAKTDKVKVHYTGTFITGEVFDTSANNKQPAEFPVNGVITGWSEALQKMRVGDKWKITIPSELAYGEEGSPPVIPPNAVLVFEVELLDIVR